jgi:hypothetical protein
MEAYVYKFAKMPLDTDRYATTINGFISGAETFGTVNNVSITEMGAQFIVTITVT